MIYEIDIEYELRAGLGVKLVETFGVEVKLTRRKDIKGMEVE